MHSTRATRKAKRRTVAPSRLYPSPGSEDDDVKRLTALLAELEHERDSLATVVELQNAEIVSLGEKADKQEDEITVLRGRLLAMHGQRPGGAQSFSSAPPNPTVLNWYKRISFINSYILSIARECALPMKYNGDYCIIELANAACTGPDGSTILPYTFKLRIHDDSIDCVMQMEFNNRPIDMRAATGDVGWPESCARVSTVDDALSHIAVVSERLHERLVAGAGALVGQCYTYTGKVCYSVDIVERLRAVFGSDNVCVTWGGE